MAINHLDVDLPGEGDNICAICHDTLDSAQNYALPECKHTFHTHCIITWFRHRASYDEHVPGGNRLVDGKCPYCGNRGINNIMDTNQRRRRFYYNLCGAELYRFTANKSDANNPKAPKILVTQVRKFNERKEKLAQVAVEFAEYKRRIKTEEVKYSEASKKMGEFRRRQWLCKHQVNRMKKLIAAIPIIPLIIPTPIDIN